MGFFQYWACFLNFPFFHYSRFLALQGRFLNVSRFSPWFLKFYKKRKTAFFTKKKSFLLHLLIHVSTFWLYGPWPLHCNQLCETFFVCSQRATQHHLFFFPFLNLNTFWVLRFLFLWTFTNLFLRPNWPTTAFLKFSKIWVLFLV